MNAGADAKIVDVLEGTRPACDKRDDKGTSCELSRRIKPRVVVECDSSSSLITEIETGRGVAIASPILRHASGKRLLYRPLTGTTEVMSVGIARSTKGDVTRAGEKFCEILRKTSDDRLWQNQSQPGHFEPQRL